ncbi:Acyl carrier protein-like protein [Pseudocohnilembus persalinus]|uniref:Acyl carrier protein n=1 Tax=Pseudocohnilembus persalinus TaxID=266149 RepID=A0A0V0QMN7_PSEPJ|nr:Acyl carrier protein-like protein [Pseudocohnilembus persalinus]|eukprot:KRX03329.1 Acyl carrier protein-like protein [Pseudocohnilembus persalinus]
MSFNEEQGYQTQYQNQNNTDLLGDNDISGQQNNYQEEEAYQPQITNQFNNENQYPEHEQNQQEQYENQNNNQEHEYAKQYSYEQNDLEQNKNSFQQLQPQQSNATKQNGVFGQFLSQHVEPRLQNKNVCEINMILSQILFFILPVIDTFANDLVSSPFTFVGLFLFVFLMIFSIVGMRGYEKNSLTCLVVSRQTVLVYCLGFLTLFIACIVDVCRNVSYVYASQTEEICIIIVSLPIALQLVVKQTQNCSKFNFITSQKRQVKQFKQYNIQCAFQNKMTFTSSSDQSQSEILEEVEAKIFQILKSAAKCKQDKLSRTATFEELGFDSLDGVELVVAMEEHFGFDIANEDAEKITDVPTAIQIFNNYMVEKVNKDKLQEMNN